MGLFDKENSKPFLTEIENRRTIYKTKTSISISDEELEEMIEHIVKYMPSAFNSQSTRIVLLLNDQHIKFWENAKTVLKDVMGPIATLNLQIKELMVSSMPTELFYILKMKML